MAKVSDTVRFIFTCNTVSKIIVEIRSRFQEYQFVAADRIDVTLRMAEILRAEGAKFSLDTLDQYINAGYPDIRKTIHLLQQNVIDGVLNSYRAGASGGDAFDTILSVIETGKWGNVRKVVCESLTSDQWEEFYTFLYNNVNKAPNLSSQDNYEEAIIVIAEHLYKHAFVADPEINVAAMLFRLGQIK